MITEVLTKKAVAGKSARLSDVVLDLKSLDGLLNAAFTLLGLCQARGT
jgi:hypothetical protein